MLQANSLFTRSSGAALAAALFVCAGVAQAQGTTQSTTQGTTQSSSYTVLVDSVAAGSATSVTNLPGESTTLSQNTDPALPSTQVLTEHQANVILTTSDQGLVTAFRQWSAVNNSGKKDTVRPRTVEIDRVVPGGGPFRYIFHDAWPTSITAGGSSSVITLVYQRAEVLR